MARSTKYLWGDTAFTMPFMFACMLVDAIIVGVTLALAGAEGSVGSGALGFPLPVALHGVVGVSAFFVIISYVLLGQQVGIKFHDPKETGANLPVMQHIAERGVYNNIEQGIPFLVLLWLNALFVNPRTTAILGWIYVASRYFYTIGFGFYGVFSNLVEVFQQLTYAINWYYLLAVLYKVASSEGSADLHSDVAAKSDWLMILVVFVGVVLNTVTFLIGGMPGTLVIVKGVNWDKGGGYDDAESGSGLDSS